MDLTGRRITDKIC